MDGLTMRAKRILRPCLALLLAGTATAATAQLRIPCSEVPPLERDFVRRFGGCVDGAPIVDVARPAIETAQANIPVPDVIGLSFDAARDRLAHFSLQRSYRASAEPGGTILAQQPAPFTRLPAGFPVTVVLSDGTLRQGPRVPASDVDGVRPLAEAPVSAPQQVPAAPAAVAIAPRDAERRATSTTKAAAVQRKSVSPSKAAARRAQAETIPVPTASSTPAPAREAVELPNVIGRSYADASGALGEFKIDRIEVAGAAASGEVLTQDPAPGTLLPHGSAVVLQVSDGSLVSAPVIAAVTPAVTTPTTPAPVLVPSPAPAPAPASVQDRFTVMWASKAVLVLAAGVLLGLVLGALLMRRWLVRRSPADAVSAMPIDSAIAISTPPTAAPAPEIRFAARLDPGETTIEFTAPPDADETTLEHSRELHE